jgi:hypothetical protein
MLTLELARVCGWEPLGTRHTDKSGGSAVDTLEVVRHLMRWQTEYLSNDGQTVTAPDAIKLADALIRAAEEGHRILADWSDGRSKPPADIQTTPAGFRWFNTIDGKDHLRSIADFCRAGAFQIY